MGIKAILFDLDDTLLDDTKATRKYRKKFYANHASEIPYPFEKFYQIWESLVASDLLNLAKGHSSIIDSRRERMRIVFNKPAMTVAEADAFIAEYLYLYENSWALFEDTIPSLIELSQSYPLGIVTNGDKEQQLQKILKFNIHKYFKIIVSCEDAKASKPEKEIFDSASAQLGLLNSECLFIGDGYDRDVVGALKAGMKPVWLIRNGSAPSNGSTEIPIIRSLTGISNLLRAKE